MSNKKSLTLQLIGLACMFELNRPFIVDETDFKKITTYVVYKKYNEWGN